jgi:hypothetical protein
VTTGAVGLFGSALAADKLGAFWYGCFGPSAP